MNTIWLMCGLPGSGKSTWAKKQPSTKRISRDEIRFSMLQEGEEYFAHENETFAKWVSELAAAVREEKNVIADATHLTWGARKKIINAIRAKGVNCQFGVVVFETPVEVCVERNAKRTGRECVPEETIRAWVRSFTDPAADPFNYYNILRVNSEGEVIENTLFKNGVF